MKIKCLIFSRDRAMQLLALLESLKLMCLDFENLECHVIYKTSTEQHEKQYLILQQMHKNIIFQREILLEADIRQHFAGIYIMFLVDDCIFINNFVTSQIVDVLKDYEILGFSLRLGANIVYSYPHSKLLSIFPEFVEISSSILAYRWQTLKFDFGYPFDVSSSVYRIGDISNLLRNVHFNTINNLESTLIAQQNLIASERPFLACYKRSRAFCAPLNLVNTTNMNRHGNKMIYTIESLANKFDKGLKIDVSKFDRFVPISCHQEVDLDWIAR